MDPKTSRAPGTAGSSASARSEGRDPYNPRATTEPFTPPDRVLPAHPASVGLSLSFGMSTEYGKEKVEVSGWCTVPCGHTQREMDAAYDICAAQIMAQLGKRMNQLIAEYHPHLLTETT